MKDSSTSARRVVSGSTDFPWDWRLGIWIRGRSMGTLSFPVSAVGAALPWGISWRGMRLSATVRSILT